MFESTKHGSSVEAWGSLSLSVFCDPCCAILDMCQSVSNLNILAVTHTCEVVQHKPSHSLNMSAIGAQRLGVFLHVLALICFAGPELCQDASFAGAERLEA